MTVRSQRFWLRPRVAPDGDVRWSVIETPFRPSPESLGPYADPGEAVAAAEPDEACLTVEQESALVTA